MLLFVFNKILDIQFVDIDGGYNILEFGDS